MDWVPWLNVLATVAGVAVVYRQLRQLSRQVELQHFSDYTKRYQDIVIKFPEDISSPEFVLAGRPDYNHSMRYLRAYFDLSFEEWYLHEKQFINEDTWALWRGGIETALSKPAFQQAWSIIKTDTRFGKDFEKFIEFSIRK
jgi:hypothetical protein